MRKYKEFIGGGEIQDVDEQINSFLEENRNIRIVDVKYNTVYGKLYSEDDDETTIYSCALITYDITEEK